MFYKGQIMANFTFLFHLILSSRLFFIVGMVVAVFRHLRLSIPVLLCLQRLVRNVRDPRNPECVCVCEREGGV